MLKADEQMRGGYGILTLGGDLFSIGHDENMVLTSIWTPLRTLTGTLEGFGETNGKH